ncbi:MAG TPA: MmcQ/YjbR family DNA-binding protein [Bacteroidia bacterium]|nr:MmcQ/YjbR family DNA-binding protein [Bacteroidia bacterium]
MNVEEIRNYCLTKKGVTESFPFDNDTLVFKLLDKMFLLISLEKQPVSFNAKCNPEKAILLREQFPNFILPGYHMNKTHWNTIIVNETLGWQLVKEQIDSSYELILKSLPKSKQLML